MSGFTVTVRPGPAMQLGGAPLTKGASVYNFSTLDSIWINSSQSVAPGNGMIVGPLGSAELSAKNDALYWACVDSGVLSPVVVSVSDDVSNMQNPEAIALATATKLLEQGLPNVLLETTLFNGMVNHGSAISLDVSAYASAVIVGGSDGMTYQQLDSNNNVIDSDYLSDLITSRISLRGIRLVVTNPFSTLTDNQIIVTCSNRAPTVRMDIRSNTAYGDTWFGVGGTTYNAGTRKLLVQKNVSCQLQGLVWASFGCGSTSKGRFELHFPDGSAIVACDTTGDMKTSSANILYAQYLMALPSHSYTVHYYSTITDTPTSAPGLTFVQAIL